MQLNQLADQLSTKTIALIAIAEALAQPDLSNPHGGTPLSADQAQQITAVFRYMRDRQIVSAKSAIAQMKAAAETDQCDRYQHSSVSGRRAMPPLSRRQYVRAHSEATRRSALVRAAMLLGRCF